MKKEQLLALLCNYGIADVKEFSILDTTNRENYRLNIFIDNKYVLRINNNVMTEERLASIDRLCQRYHSIGILTPRLYKNKEGRYISPAGEYICYLSDYIDLPTADQIECDHKTIQCEILKSIGALSQKYSDIDLSQVNSMWSIIDLAPLDVDIDEKQENLNLFVSTLKQLQEEQLADRVVRFNEAVRKRIKAVYKTLPRCVIHGDLNDTNILVKDNHFAGLIDFDMAGTEVNVNHFCAETNGFITTQEFDTHTAQQLYKNWTHRQDAELDIILQKYTLNRAEETAIADYRSIGLISQYPNVIAYIEFLKRDRAKAVQLVECILERIKYNE